MSGSEGKYALNMAKLVYWLLTRARGVRVSTIMRRLDIKDRTYRKYRRDLRERFEPFRREDGTSLVEEVRYDDDKYLRLVAMDPVEPRDREFVARLAAIHLARQLFRFVSDTDVGEVFDDLFAELQSRTKEKVWYLKHILANTERMFYHAPWAPKDYSAHRETLGTILHCLFYTRRMKLDYDSASSERHELVVEPYSLLTHRGGLYLVARNVDYDEARTFAVDRIASATQINERFEYPTPARYDPARYTEGCFGIFRNDDDESVDVELIFVNERWLIADLTERRWHPTQRFERLDDGRLRMRFAVNSMVEVWPWIRSFGDKVEVISPS